jgi:hypothetical protein
MQPGECVSVNTLELPTPGLVAQAKGTLTNGRYNYATVFVDQYSGLDYVHLHRTNSGDKILAAKLAFSNLLSLMECKSSIIMLITAGLLKLNFSNPY